MFITCREPPFKPSTRSGAAARVCALLVLAVVQDARADSLVAPELLEGQTLALPSPEPVQDESASVLLAIEVDAAGAVRAAELERVDSAAPDTRPFVEAAVAHAFGLRFRPASHDGVAVSAGIRVEIAFSPAAVGQAEPIENAPRAAPPNTPDAPSTPDVASEVSSSTPGRAAAASNAPTSPSRAPARTTEAELSANARIPHAPEPVAASDFDIEIGALRRVPRRSAERYLTLAPGVVLQNHAGTGHASAILLRGFDAGEGEDLEVRVEGVPINEPSNAHAHGYADTHFLIPELVDRVRVLEGPFDPRQGDFAVAGSASYALGVRERGLRARGEYGRFAERRGLLLWAPEGEAPGTFAAFDLRAGDGYGPNRAHSSFRTLLGYEHSAGELRYRVLGAAHAGSFDSAGIVREDDFEARRLPCAPDARSQFYCLYDPNQGGSASGMLLSGGLGWLRPGRNLELNAYLGRRGFRGRENFTGFLVDERGDGLDQRYEAATFGLRGSYELSRELWGRPQRLELGAEARHDAGRTRMWRVRREGAVPYETVFDTDLALTHGAAHVRLEFSPLSWLTLLGGVRADVFAFSILDLAAPERDRAGERLPLAARDAWGTALSPRATLRARVLEPLWWITSAGTGVRSSDARALSEGESAPFTRAHAIDTGPALELADRARALRLSARAFAFATHVEQELLFDAERGRNVPAGASNRFGAGTSARLQIGAVSDTLVSFAWSDARLPPDGASPFDLGAGPALPFVPRHSFRLDQACAWTLRVGAEPVRLSGGLGVSWVGPRPLPLGRSSEAVLDVAAAIALRVRMFELGLSVENLFDARNRIAEFNHPSHFDDPGAPASLRSVRHFAAGAPRLWLLTLTAYLDERPFTGEAEP